MKGKLAVVGFVIAPEMRSAAAKFTIRVRVMHRFLFGSKTTARITRILPTMLVRNRTIEMTVVEVARASGALVKC